MTSLVTSASFKYEILGTFAECDLVAVVGKYSQTGIIVDMFRLRDNKIMEHWDSDANTAAYETKFTSPVKKSVTGMRETIESQRREIVETIMSADAACIALVCQPDGERSLISPNLEALRAKLNGLGESVREHLALETIIGRELNNPEADFERRLQAAKNTSAKK